MATAGRHHRACAATSRGPHHHLAWPVRLPLPISPGVNASANPFGGFGVTCHCEERSDVAIALILSLSKDANEIATLRSQ